MDEAELIAVYGSLKEGFYNHNYFLSGAERLPNSLATGMLFSLGAYPALSEGVEEVEVELYRVSPETYRGISAMELGAGYEEWNLNTPYGAARCWRMPFHHCLNLEVVEPDEDGVVRWREQED